MTGKPTSCQLFILSGSQTLELSWIYSSSKSGQVSVARATSTGFGVRQDNVCTDLESVAEQAHEAWKLLHAEPISPTGRHLGSNHPVTAPIEPLPTYKGTNHIETAFNTKRAPTPSVTTPTSRTRNELRAAILDSLRHVDTSAPLYLTADILNDALLPRFRS
ncbi:hypothetical protein ASF98_21245 [Arthrobacter sp. Leaf337]|nr:hypothetical protein ASF98_21245 [Arthrobacter sp. Leaf337]